MIPFDMNKPL